MIFRPLERKLPFTQISNELLGDPKLSGKAKWILMYILSKPANWIVYEKDIIKHGKDGRDAIRAGIHQLISAGYISRKQVRTKKGKFHSFEYRVSETPEFIEVSPKTDFPASDNPPLSNTYLKEDGISEHTEEQLEDISTVSTMEHKRKERLNNEL